MSRKIAREISFKVIFSSDFQNEEEKIEELIKGLESDSKEITKEGLENILKSSKKILNEAIKYKGTTIKSFTSAYHQKGSYQNYLKVHTKNTCLKCGKPILKDKINGRSTYYCEVCQKVKKWKNK